MNRKFLAVVLCAGALAIAVSSSAFARGALQSVESDYRSWGTPHASAGVSGTQEKTLVHKQSTGHYSVCNHGSHSLMVSTEATSATVGSGDCMAIEAKTISVKGTHDSAFNRAFIYNHTHFHPHGR